MSNINMHQLKDRAQRIEDITDEQWKLCLKENRDMVDEYLKVNKQLSPKTKIQYITCLKQFFVFVCDELNNKPWYKITKRDFIKYMSAMQERDLSSSAIGLRKSAVSSLCKYIENVVIDDDSEPDIKKFRNFTNGMPSISRNSVYEKVAITKEEYEILMKELEKQEDYLAMAWVATAFNTAARRAELIQFKSEIVNYPIKDGKNYIVTHNVRGKGASREGKIVNYLVNFEALEYIKLWLEKRGYEHEYIFTVKEGNKYHPVSISWANNLCKEKLSVILGRRINPHLFKASCVTYLLEKGVDLKIVSKYIAHHNDTNTTSSFYDLRDFEEEKDQIF